MSQNARDCAKIESQLLEHARLTARVCVVGLTPLFERWASGAAHDVFDKVRAAVEGDSASGANIQLLGEIDRLPEAAYDDSHHRDFFVMMALGVLSFAVALYDRADAAAMRHLRSQVGLLGDALGIRDLPTEIESLILKGAMADEPHLARDAESISSHVASRVNAALEPTARKYGWPPDRVVPLA